MSDAVLYASKSIAGKSRRPEPREMVRASVFETLNNLEDLFLVTDDDDVSNSRDVGVDDEEEAEEDVDVDDS